VVTKSGTTAEPMSQFLVVREMLERELGADYKRHLVCTTDPGKGRLRAIAADEGLETLPIPPGAGGRFSVLSAVGVFPAVATGMDVDSLLAGAREMDERTRSGDLWRNPALMQAAVLHLASRRGINVHVMMPYSQALRDYADWYCQLLGESLGKEVALDGSRVNAGLTPVKALGATDQHSQMQLYREGPYDKLITIIQVERPESELPLPGLYGELEGVSYLGGRTMRELMAAECRGTQVALEKAGRPYEVLRVSKVEARSVGALVYFNEIAIAYAGELFGVNAFDQPGVQAGKDAAYALMGREGYEGLRAEVEKSPPPQSRYCL
jgi:glucose-6-phosphate isomerase